MAKSSKKGSSKKVKLSGTQVGENVAMEIEDDHILVVRIDLNHRGNISDSGKTTRVASTMGNQAVPFSGFEKIKIGINSFDPIPKSERNG